MINKLELQKYDIQEEIRRVATEICNDGLEELIVHSNPDEIVIHNTRKRIKFLRALLRLVKYDLDKVHYSSQNNFLRHIKNLSTNQREIIVLEKAVLQLLSTSTKNSTIAFLERVHSSVMAEKEIINREPTHEALVGRYQKLLQVYKNLIREWPFSKKDLKQIITGMTVIYDSARRLLLQSRTSRDVHSLHDLRKRTKDLYHIFSVIVPASTKEYRHTTILLKKLSDILGDIHDLFAIPDFIEKVTPGVHDDPVFLKIKKRTQRKIDARIDKALKLSDEVYKQTPYKFRMAVTRRLTRYSSKHFKPDF